MPGGDFETNRCGFCVLHPIVGLAGSRLSLSMWMARASAIP
jgi:hypothetical protein